MSLYLIRHGVADSENARSAPGHYHEPGSLTDKGRDSVLKGARMLKKKGVKIDEIWYSTKLRAKQTADIIADELGVKEVYKKTFLLPNDPIDKCIEKLNGCEEINLAIVSHLPFLPDLISALIPSLQEKINIAWSGIVCLELKDGKWKISWMMGAAPAS